MNSVMLTPQEAAAFLRTRDNFLILTHIRPRRRHARLRRGTVPCPARPRQSRRRSSE